MQYHDQLLSSNIFGEVAEVLVVMFFVCAFLIHAVYYAIVLLFLYIFLYYFKFNCSPTLKII